MPSHREILKVNRQARRKRYFRRSVLVAILVILTLSFGGWYFWNAPAFALTQIIINGNKTVSTARLTAAVNGVLAGQYLGFFERQVNWFYPRAALLAALEKQFPEFDAVTAANLSFGTLRVDVSERRPVALWCEGETCYFIDQTGLLYAPAPRFSNTPLFTLTGLVLPNPIGSRPLAISDFQHLLDVQATINQLLRTAADFSGQTVTSAALTAPVDYIFTVRNPRLESTGWQLLVPRRAATAGTIARLAAAFSSPAFLAEYRSSSSTLQYLDGRFNRKVFYKFM